MKMKRLKTFEEVTRLAIKEKCSVLNTEHKLVIQRAYQEAKNSDYQSSEFALPSRLILKIQDYCDSKKYCCYCYITNDCRKSYWVIGTSWGAVQEHEDAR